MHLLYKVNAINYLFASIDAQRTFNKGKFMLIPNEIGTPIKLTEAQSTLSKKLEIEILNTSSCYDGCKLTSIGHKDNIIAIYHLYDGKQHSACFDNEDKIDDVLSTIAEQKKQSFVALDMANLAATGGRIMFAFK